MIRSRSFCPPVWAWKINFTLCLPIFVGEFSDTDRPACMMRGLCCFVVVTQHVLRLCSSVILLSSRQVVVVHTFPAVQLLYSVKGWIAGCKHKLLIFLGYFWRCCIFLKALQLFSMWPEVVEWTFPVSVNTGAFAWHRFHCILNSIMNGFNFLSSRFCTQLVHDNFNLLNLIRRN